MSGVAIRPARIDDAPDIATIYSHHVLNGTASFDTIPPEEEFWREKIGHILSKGWPFLAAERDGELLGYCYATQLRERPGYAPSCEDSIYVRADCAGQGVGTALLESLIVASRAAGFEQMVAVIGGAEPASVALHAKMGFIEAGRLKNGGFKFGRYLDSVYMQRDLTG